jgi:hypothetical protein
VKPVSIAISAGEGIKNREGEHAVAAIALWRGLVIEQCGERAAARSLDETAECGLLLEPAAGR